MQNLKRCPKCNGVPTDTKTKFCPFDGTPLITQSSQPEQSFTPLNKPVSLNYYLLRAGIAIAVLFVIAFFLRPNQSDNTRTTQQSNKQIVNQADTSSFTQPNLDEIEIKNRIEKGEQLYKAIETKYNLPFSFDEKINDAAMAIRLTIPKKEWNAFSKDDQLNLTYYSQNLIRLTRLNPSFYVDEFWKNAKSIKGNVTPCSEYNGLTRDEFIKRVANLCDSCWQITIGNMLMDKGRLSFFGEETLVDGKNVDSFREYVNRNGAKLTEYEEAKKNLKSTNLSSSELYATAKKILDDEYTTYVFGDKKVNLTLPRAYLEAIEPDTSDYKEAQKLLKEVARREQTVENRNKRTIAFMRGAGRECIKK